ncbi:hypothetical protein Tco_1203420 [Tanacetum coccineum]
MADLIFADSHNMVAYLEKLEDNVDFAEIVDFLNTSPIRYALIVSPTVYVSYIEQFWSTTKIKTVNNETQIHAKVDGKTIVITESSVRRYLHFNDEDALFNDEYDTPSHTKKVFANMRRKGKDFSGTVTPLFPSILAPQVVEGKGSGQPTEPQHIPTTASPSHVELIQFGPTTLVANETIHKERGDNVERAATTATSLDAERGSGGSPRCQEAMGDTIAQTRSERVSIPSYDSPLPGVNTHGTDEERIELKELMDMCTKLSDRVLDLENVKNAQALEIQKLKKRVKKLESKKKSRTPQLKMRLFKFQEDSETQGRYGHGIGVNTASISITIASINITTAKPVITASAPLTTAGVSVITAEPSTPPPTTTITTTPIEDEDLTIAQTLMKMKSEKSKAKGVNMQEPSESGTRVRVPPPQIDPKDKGKVKMVEPKKPKKKKDQIEYDADVAQILQAELDEEARLEREREVEAIKAANIAECDDLVKGSEIIKSEVDRAVPELAAGSSKRDAEEELDQEKADELSQEELQQMMIIVPEQGMNVEALQTKYPIIDWEIYTECTRKYWKITIVGNHTEVHHFFDDMLKAFNMDDLVMLWSLVKEKFNSTEPTNDKEREIWSASCVYREGNRHLHAGREGVSIVKRNSYIDVVAKLLVDQDNEMSRELLRKIFMQGRIVGIKRLLSSVEVNAASFIICYYCCSIQQR